MARLFQRTSAQKQRDQEASEASLRSGTVSARVTTVEELLTDVDIVDVKDRLIVAETTIEDHETRITALETP